MEADPVADPMADPWALADPWQVDPGMAMERENLPVRVRRLNGELLEVSLTKQKANKIELIRELKRCLAKNDPRMVEAPFSIWCIRLMHMDVEIHDREPVNWEWMEEGSVQYIVVDVMSLPSDTLPSDDEMVLCWKDLDQLFDPRLLITRAYQVCKERGQVFCEHVFSAWTSAVRCLSHEEVNAVEGPLGKTVLNRCLALLQALDDAEDMIREEDPETFRNLRDPEIRQIALESFFDKHLPGDSLEEFLLQTCASMTIELVREKLTRQTVEASFDTYRPSRETVKADVWSLVLGRKCDDVGLRGRNLSVHLSTGAFHYYGDGLGAHLLMALIDKGLPRWCWAGRLGPFNDSLLQYVLEPANAPDPKRDAEGELCIFLAEKFSLEELCHLNEDGKVALDYAEEYAGWQTRISPRPPPQDQGLWSEVPRVIKQQMEEKVRCFEGSLIELMELARRVLAGLGGEVDGLESLPAFEEQMWQRAGNIRQEWLRMGWRFAADSTNGQISEVLSWHFEAVGRGIRHR